MREGGLGGKKWYRRVSATDVVLSASGRWGKHCRGRPNAYLLAVPKEGEVAEERKSDQWGLLAEEMALK